MSPPGIRQRAGNTTTDDGGDLPWRACRICLIPKPCSSFCFPCWLWRGAYGCVLRRLVCCMTRTQAKVFLKTVRASVIHVSVNTMHHRSHKADTSGRTGSCPKVEREGREWQWPIAPTASVTKTRGPENQPHTTCAQSMMSVVLIHCCFST
jgi:hypothetical protein